jgi:hypothetical protein
MIGGSPVFPQYYPSAPPVYYNYNQPTAPRPAVTSAVPPAPQPGPRAPVIRGLPPDEPTPAPRHLTVVSIPTPEEVGVAASRPAAAAVDWAATHRRLQELGVVGFCLERLPDGGSRFSCLLPRPGAASPQRIEASAGREHEAVRLCLEQAGRWKNQQP